MLPKVTIAGVAGKEEIELTQVTGEALGVPVVSVAPCGGGDINRAWKLGLGDGRTAFFKSRADAPAGEFRAEAAGLRWLAEPAGLRVPEVLAVVDPPGRTGWRGLVLEWVEASGSRAGGSRELGRGLAIVHSAGAERHGAAAPGSGRGEIRFGRAVMPAPGPGEVSFAEVYASRVEALAAQALDRGAIDRDDAAVFTALAAGIDRFAGPEQPPARLHGDLWSGNVMTGPDERPWLIDPAAHGGHRELDLAMLELFGSPGAEFYAAYEEVSPLDPDRPERINLWQVQPLLVHAILFGGHYGAAATTAARSYTR